MFLENLLIDIAENIIRFFYFTKILPNMLEFKNDNIQRFLLTHQAFINFFSGGLLHETTFFYNYLSNGDALYRWPL